MNDDFQGNQLIEKLLEHIELARAACFSLKLKWQHDLLPETAEKQHDDTINIDEMMMLIRDAPNIANIHENEERIKIIMDWLSKMKSFRNAHYDFNTKSNISGRVKRILEIEQDTIRLAAKVLILRDDFL